VVAMVGGWVPAMTSLAAGGVAAAVSLSLRKFNSDLCS